MSDASGGRDYPGEGSEPFVINLDDICAADRERVGAKAANLGAMLRAGFPVPGGFCVTTAAFRRVVADADLTPMVTELATMTGENIDELQRVGAALRARLVAAALPSDLDHAILSTWERHLRRRPCAVRSSATAEDLADASFAGQQDTTLNIRHRDALRSAIRQCWASLYSDRALAYRVRNGVDHARVSMAIVVQELVAADAAGVLFTFNPSTGSADEMMIEGSVGLGEGLASGRVSPDRWIVRKQDWQVIERTVSDKDLRIVALGAGGVDAEAVPPEMAGAACISDGVAQDLAQLGERAQQLFGSPQDMEWAVSGSQAFVLQSRPISTRISRSFETHQIWSNLNAGEVLPDVISPMTWSLLERTLLRLFDELLTWLGFDASQAPLVGRIGGRAYFNLNTVTAFARALPTGRTADIMPLFGGLQAELDEHGGWAILEEHVPRVTLSRRRMLARVPRLIAWWLTQSTGVPERNLARLTRQLDEQQRRAFTGLSDDGLIAAANADVDRFREAMMALCGPAVVGVTYFSTLNGLCQRWFPDEPGTINELLTGIGGMSSAEAGLDMWRLAALAHRQPQTEQALLAGGRFADARAQLQSADGGTAFLRRWDEFMVRHGHHARGEIDVINPRWAEEPDYVLEQVRSYLRHMDGKDSVAIHHGQAGTRARRVQALRRGLKNPLKRLAFDISLRGAQRGIRYRENLKSEAVRLTALVRGVALELGRRFAARGVLAQVDDIFFLTFDELPDLRNENGAGTTLGARIAQRRAEFARNQAVTPPALVVGDWDPDRSQREASSEQVERLRGLGVSAGIVTGTARVILRSDTKERILPGEILVAPFTDPGWTPYFQLAAGLVTDLGGMLSHGSIVAREYGLPAVVNVGPATRVIRTGDRLHVDGNRGEVCILR